MTTEDLPPTAAEKSRIRIHRSLVIMVVIGVILAVVYVLSIVAYRAGLDQNFTPPEPPQRGVAVALLPIRIDADARMAATDVLLFPDASLLDTAGRLRKSIQLDLYPTAAGGTLYFEQGTVPSPQKVEVPIVGYVQRYPFDAYKFSLKATSLKDSGEITAASADPLPVRMVVEFKVPGWRFSDSSPPQVGQTSAVATGTILRSGPIIAIAVIFITLILMMGVLAVLTVVTGVRGRSDLGISQAAWLTSATFALIALRNAFPGSPPLGSWIDILVYFWVITAIMLMIGLAVVTNLIRQARNAN